MSRLQPDRKIQTDKDRHTRIVLQAIQCQAMVLLQRCTPSHQLRSRPSTRSMDSQCHQPPDHLLSGRRSRKEHDIWAPSTDQKLASSASRLGRTNIDAHRITEHLIPSPSDDSRHANASQVRERPWYSQVSVRLTLENCQVCSRKCQEGVCGVCR